MNNTLIITGMHRSGTSMTASWLETCGLLLSNNLEGDIGNERGHFEDTEFLALHINSIKRQCSKSKGWITNKNSIISFDIKESKVAQAILSSRDSVKTVWGWKDPRTTLFLKDYKKIDDEIKVLLLWRDCTEVVDSLLRRSNNATKDVFIISFSEALATWINYNREVIRFAEANKKNVILCSINKVIELDTLLIERINELFKFKLELKSIQNIFENKDLNTGKVDLSFIQKTRIKLSEARHIQAKLSELSIV